MSKAWSALLVLGGAFLAKGQEGPARQGPEFEPEVHAASDEGELARRRFEVASGFVVRLFAAEPMLANPVTFCVDSVGRFFVAETFRHHAGVTDTREHMDWLDADLACRTVADREHLLRSREADNLAHYTQQHERIRVLTDQDGDGRADAARTYADGFHDLVGGIGAGLLARGDTLYFTNIPHLWRLEDRDGDGSADARRSLHEGYGVHISLLGHDLHGLRMGPDGRLYFSIGDRGFHVEVEGQVFAFPDTGAVLRCEPDGSRLEVFAFGLRNPQELVFDELGNLFTGDNNSDGGDEARFVYVVEGGNSGWHIGYQWIEGSPARGPWNEEKLWHPAHEGQAAYIVPPIANIAAGPSGLTYHPGTGLGGHYRGQFFLCDFRGDPGISGVWTFRLSPRGAGFALDGRERFLWKSLVTDVDFGVDGSVYVTDWVDGWNKTGKGRIYRIGLEDPGQDAAAVETRGLLFVGMGSRQADELVRLLDHADQRVRQEAQFELADRGSASAPALLARVRAGAPLLGRLHALWALGQLHRTQGHPLDTSLLTLFEDPQAEVRAQMARLAGDVRLPAARPYLEAGLRDFAPRVRFFAAEGLSKVGTREHRAALVEMIAAAGDADPFLRHAGILGLARCARPEDLTALAGDGRAPVRRAAVVALRRQHHEGAAAFLHDSDATIALEAARAIHDEPIVRALPSLAALLGQRAGMEFALARRAVNAAYRLGGRAHALELARRASDAAEEERFRIDALEALRDWANPFERDRVVNLYRPLPPRGAEDAAAALEAHADELLATPSVAVRTAAAVAVGRTFATAAAPRLARFCQEPSSPLPLREAALQAIADLGSPALRDAVSAALRDEAPSLRSLGRELLAQLSPDEAFAALREALEQGTTSERKSALDVLAGLEHEGVDELLMRWLDRRTSGEVAPELHLELWEAAASRRAAPLQSALARWEETFPAGDEIGRGWLALRGGDAAAGRKLFFEKTEAQCLRCHAVAGEGAGVAGPDLGGVALRLSREQLLEAILAPNRSIAEGFRNENLFLTDGDVVSARVIGEDAEKVKIYTVDHGEQEIEKSRIRQRRPGLSSMPTNFGDLLGTREIRDLVEYLAGRKDAGSPGS